jgi:cytochrome c2
MASSKSTKPTVKKQGIKVRVKKPVTWGPKKMKAWEDMPDKKGKGKAMLQKGSKPSTTVPAPYAKGKKDSVSK